VQSTHPTGFTLVEAVLSMLLVATVLVAALEMVGASARARVVEKEQARSKELARQLLDEIMQNDYADPGPSPGFGPESGETRATFNDVDDFDNWRESLPQTKSGVPLPGYDGWSRKVKVSWADPAKPGTSSGSETGLKRITVTVTTPTGKETTLTALRCKESAYAKKYDARTTYVGGVNITLQVGSETGAKVVSGVNLVNQVP
jgi:MSHA pilin protein MshD